MREFLVWAPRVRVETIVAASEQDAAEAFLQLPVTARPAPGEPPTCFVQLKGDDASPRGDGSATAFWVSDMPEE